MQKGLPPDRYLAAQMRAKDSLFIVLCLASVHYCFGQQQVRLKNVAKVLLIYRGAVAYGGGRTVAIVSEHNKWNAYQTLLLGDHNIKRDTIRKFVKQVDKSTLNKLFKIINKADTGLHISNFNIDKKLLIKYIDSASRNSRIPDAERPIFERYLQTDANLQKALRTCLGALRNSDYSYKYIYIITKDKDTLKVNAISNKIYYLPWYIKGRLNYNPAIDALFNTLFYDNYAKAALKDGYFYTLLCKCAYMDCFHKNRSLRFFYYENPEIIRQINAPE